MADERQGGDEREGRGGGFLPPEPGGREPELEQRSAEGGDGPQSPAPGSEQGSGFAPPTGAEPGPAQPPAGVPQAGGWQQPQQGSPQGGGWQQPQQGSPQGGGWQQPQQGSPQQPQQGSPQQPQQWGQQPQQQWGQQQGWGQQPQPWQQQGNQQQQWVYQPRPAEPDNGAAVAGFSLSVAGAGLLVMTFGASSIVSVVCSALGIFYSRRGRERVDRGETPKHRGLAQAGFITGIVSLVLAVLATVFWVLILVLALTDDQFRRDLERDFERTGGSGATALGVLGAIVRGLGALVG